MQTVTMCHRADQGERFAPSAFEGQIGKTIPVHVGDRTVAGTVVSAEVASDGSEVLLTMEVPDGTVPI